MQRTRANPSVEKLTCANRGAFLNYIVAGPNTFLGAIDNGTHSEVRVVFNGDGADVLATDASGSVTQFNLTCVGFKSNGNAPSRIGASIVPATVAEALAIIQN